MFVDCYSLFAVRCLLFGVCDLLIDVRLYVCLSCVACCVLAGAH